MHTRRYQALVSVFLFMALGAGACAGRQQFEGIVESVPDVLQFDNLATVHVDVYLVGAPVQWRLGRVPPGMHVSLKVPAAATEWTAGFVQLAVIPGSQVNAQAARDPRTVTAIPQPVSAILSQRWTFRQPAGAALQLQAASLKWR